MSLIAARLERLPFSKFHRRLLIMGGLGYCFDAVDLGIIAFVLPSLMAQWSLTTLEAGVLASATYVGFFFGAFSAGVAGDVIGRRVIMLWALGVYCAASFASAFAASPTEFFAERVVAGFGIGAEGAIIAPYLTEFVAKGYRGKFVGALLGFFAFGSLGVAVLGYLVVPVTPWGWRLALAITALPVLVLLWWRRALPESPRWLESRGREAEAEGILSKIETEIALGQCIALPPPQDIEPVPLLPRRSALGNLASLGSRPMVRITAMTWLLWLSITSCYYSFFTWIPTLLVHRGMTIAQSFAYSMAIYAAQIPGFFSAAYFNDRIGRRATIVTYLGLGAVAAIGLTSATSDIEAVSAGIFLSLFMNGAFGAVYTYTAEVFPTSIRATGTGVASGIGRLGAIGAPILVGAIFPKWGFLGVFGITTGVLIAGAAVVVVLGVPTRHLSLEAITAGEFHD
jgi:MFS transporter, putative metabolite:H+ symporter